MSLQVIPLDTNPNQTWQVAVSINGLVVNFFVLLQYNEIAQYWSMNIYDNSQVLLLAGIALVTGLNLLRQFQYLGIGSLYILNASGIASPNFPDDTNLGSDFVMLWGDNA